MSLGVAVPLTEKASRLLIADLVAQVTPHDGQEELHRTRGPHSHTDVTLWFVLDGDRAADIRPDPGEFRATGWVGLDRAGGWGADRFDPHMDRFMAKLNAAVFGA